METTIPGTTKNDELRPDNLGLLQNNLCPGWTLEMDIESSASTRSWRPTGANLGGGAIAP